jgi:hypothetical protein
LSIYEKEKRKEKEKEIVLQYIPTIGGVVCMTLVI